MVIDAINVQTWSSFFPRSNLNLNHFCTTFPMNPKLKSLFQTLIKDFFVQKKLKKIMFPGGNIFLYWGYSQKIGVHFSRRSKYVHK